MKAGSADSEQVSISKLISVIFTPFDTLKDFGKPTDRWSDLIVFFTTSPFEESTQLEWQKSLGNSTE